MADKRSDLFDQFWSEGSGNQRFPYRHVAVGKVMSSAIHLLSIVSPLVTNEDVGSNLWPSRSCNATFTGILSTFRHLWILASSVLPTIVSQRFQYRVGMAKKCTFSSFYHSHSFSWCMVQILVKLYRKYWTIEGFKLLILTWLMHHINDASNLLCYHTGKCRCDCVPHWIIRKLIFAVGQERKLGEIGDRSSWKPGKPSSVCGKFSSGPWKSERSFFEIRKALVWWWKILIRSWDVPKIIIWIPYLR